MVITNYHFDQYYLTIKGKHENYTLIENFNVTQEMFFNYQINDTITFK